MKNGNTAVRIMIKEGREVIRSRAYPFEIKRIQSDNGSETEDCAHDYMF
jgi:hypothetical protein